MAKDAGTPSNGMLRMERSILMSVQVSGAKRRYILRPKSPLRRIPAINKLMPTANWLSFPIDGTNGLPTALSQTWCNDDSISLS